MGEEQGGRNHAQLMIVTIALVASRERKRESESEEEKEGEEDASGFWEGEVEAVYIFISLNSGEKPEKEVRSSGEAEEGKQKPKKLLQLRIGSREALSDGRNGGDMDGGSIGGAQRYCRGEYLLFSAYTKDANHSQTIWITRSFYFLFFH